MSSPGPAPAPPAPALKTAYIGYCGLIDAAGVTKIAQAVNSAVNAPYQDIYLCLTSNGGYMGDGIYLYNHLKALPLPITIHNTGTVASIATTLFMGVKTRFCSPHGMFMMHPVAVGAKGQSMAIKPLQESLQAAITDEDRTEAILRAHTKLPDGILAQRRETDVYITAKDALGYGLVDKICDFTLPAGEKIFQI
jgi:ATP-dependent Clp protease, protease subunit